MDEELRGLVEKAYENILGTANRILRNCRTFTINRLQEEDPTYEQIAEHLRDVANVIGAVHQAYPHDAEGFRTAAKAKEYATNVANIAAAIKLGDSALLKEFTVELERRPFS